jgi:hypothetical protein
MDIMCAKCGEPWDSTLQDLEYEERSRFRNGEGCPACEFGTRCISCSGTGKYQSYSQESPDYCSECMGVRSLIVRKLPDGWAYGYENSRRDIQYLPKSIDPTTVHLNEYPHYTLWEPSHYQIRCYHCIETAVDCARCGGNGGYISDESSILRSMVYELLGDDTDGIAATLEDFNL